MDTEEVKTAPPTVSKWVRIHCEWNLSKVYIFTFIFLLFFVVLLFFSMSHIQIKLNVGGKHFMTSRETLMRDSNSMLARLVSDESDLISDKVCAIWFIQFHKTKQKKKHVSWTKLNSLALLTSHMQTHDVSVGWKRCLSYWSRSMLLLSRAQLPSSW